MENKIKAVAYQTPGDIDRDDALQDITLAKPTATGRELLVQIHAVSVNPVDTKVRKHMAPVDSAWRVLGFDASGIVEAVGPEVENFKVGDAVYYAGSISRAGTNSEFHLVDERIVGHKPESINHAEAAALPLTAITAWEMLFDRLKVNQPTPQGGHNILVIGGAGGVGSITIQLLRALTDVTIIATASRPETKEWVKQSGAHYVIDHSHPLAAQIEELGIGSPGFVFSTTQTEQHVAEIAQLIAPQGRFGLIDDPQHLDIMAFKQKAISLHWEFMFTRPLFDTPDLSEQGRLLNALAELVDKGLIQSTATLVAGKIDAENLRKAHRLIEGGKVRGKIVLEGF